MPADASGDTELARRATGGDGEAFGLLFDRWLDRAFDVAWHVLHNREGAADATQDAFAAAWQQIGNLRQPESFGGWLLRITRNKALNHLRKQRRSSPVGSEETLEMMDPRRTEEPSLPLDRQEHGDLVWAASAALGEEDASLLGLHLRNDLSAPELAEELGVRPNAAHQRLFRLRKRLGEAMGAWVLWRKGKPSCPELSDALAKAEVTSFDAATAKAILAHARRCESCDSSSKLQLSPEALFAALPMMAAGPVLRARMVAALDGQGVPVGTRGDAAGHEPGSTLEGDGPGSQESWDGDEAAEPGGSPGPAGWHRVARIGAPVAVLLLVGLGVLGLLVDRSGDSSGDEAGTRTASGADIASGETVTEPGEGVPDEPPGTTTSDDEAVSGEGDPQTPGPGIEGPTPGGSSDTGDAAGSGPTGSSGSTTGPEGPPAPEIVRFTAVSTGRPCHSTDRTSEVRFSWATTDATSATLGRDGGGAEPVPPSSSVTRCTQPGGTWILTASGPGDPPASARATVPPEPTPSTRPPGPGDLVNP